MSRKRVIFVTSLLILTIKGYSQFNEDFNYKRWRIHLNNMVYRPAVVDLQGGDYTIRTKVMRGYRVGFEYYFRNADLLQFFTGLNMHFIPLDNYEYQIPGKELGLDKEVYYNNTFRQMRTKRNVLAVPLGIVYHVELRNKISLHYKGGINLDFIQDGQFSMGYEITNDYNFTKRYFDIEMRSQNNSIVYPSVFLGSGIDFYTSWAKLHFTLNVQKAIIPYMKGGFRFYNLDVSEDAYGTYKLWGDHIGLDVGITLKKFKKKDRS